MSEPNEVVAEPTTEEAIEQAEAVTEVETEASPPEDGQAPEGEQPEGNEEPEAEQRKRESAKERRERQRAAREKTEADLADAQARLDRIKRATQGQEEPQRDKFDDPDEYIAAKAAWSSAQTLTQQQVSYAESEVEHITQAQKQVAEQSWNDQMQEGRERYPDFDQKVTDPNAPIFGAVPDIIKTSDMGAELAYHLASNHAEALKISRMPPLAAAVAMGKLEAALSAPPPRTETKAPPPIETVEGAAQPSKDPSKMSPDQYRAWRQSGGSF